MLQLQAGDHSIEITNEPTYSFASADNSHRFLHQYWLDEAEYHVASCHGVRVLAILDEREVSSCVLGSTGGATGIHNHSAFVHDTSLIMAVGPYMVSLQLPDLQLAWRAKSDWATCFGVYHCPNHRCYLSHGELEFARVGYDGSIQWRVGGADIFTNGFRIVGDRVEAIDFYNTSYAWDIRSGAGLWMKPVAAIETAKSHRDAGGQG